MRATSRQPRIHRIANAARDALWRVVTGRELAPARACERSPQELRDELSASRGVVAPQVTKLRARRDIWDVSALENDAVRAVKAALDSGSLDRFQGVREKAELLLRRIENNEASFYTQD